MKPCLICGKTQFKTHFIVDSYPILKCCFCGFMVTYGKDVLQKEINKKVYSSAEYKKFYLGKPTKNLLATRARKRLKELEALYPKQGRMLDVGASYGIFLAEAKKRGWEVIGNELNQRAVNYLQKKGFKIFVGDYLSIRLPSSFFDVVCMWDVLEHLKNPKLALLKTHRILKRDGLLALQLPNVESLSAKIGQSKWGWLTPPDHLYHFSPKTIRSFLEKNGFEVVHLATFNEQEEITSGFAQRISPAFQTLINLIHQKFPYFFKPFILLESKFLLSGLIIAYAKKV